jgi:hypothetical protein
MPKGSSTGNPCRTAGGATRVILSVCARSRSSAQVWSHVVQRQWAIVSWLHRCCVPTSLGIPACPPSHTGQPNSSSIRSCGSVGSKPARKGAHCVLEGFRWSALGMDDRGRAASDQRPRSPTARCRSTELARRTVGGLGAAWRATCQLRVAGWLAAVMPAPHSCVTFACGSRAAPISRSAGAKSVHRTLRGLGAPLGRTQPESRCGDSPRGPRQGR